MSIDPDDDDEVAVVGIPNGNVSLRHYEARQFETRQFDPSRRSIMLDPETGLLGPNPDAGVSTPLRLPVVSNHAVSDAICTVLGFSLKQFFHVILALAG